MLMDTTSNTTDVNNTNIAYVMWFIVGLLLFLVSAVVAHSHQLTGLQARIFYDFDNLTNSFKQPALWMTEGLGSAIPIVICVVVAALFKKYRLAWRFFVTSGGAFAVAYIIKEIVKEPRPVAMLNNHLVTRAVETGPGFPSGHATVATALALTLWLVLPTKWRWISILWILVVGVSRLYLGVHTPVDVIGGFAIGLMAFCFVSLLPRAISRPLRLDSLDDVVISQQ
jgi:undecaprenyl-diphosphatase